MSFYEDGKVDLPKGDEEKVLNLAQDVIGVVSRQPLPKHVGIALHILKETHSKNLVTMLNKFGNSISYSSAQRYITTFANNVSKQEQKDGVHSHKHCPRPVYQIRIRQFNFSF